MAKTIETIPIDPEGRYVLLLKGVDDTKVAERLQEHLLAWWESDRPFTILSLSKDIDLRFERVGPETP